jgi:membrane protein
MARPEAHSRPAPQPEHHEPRIADPRLRDLSTRDYRAILIRAGREALDDGITDSAAALAYYAFLSLPAVLLVTLGVFGVVAGPSAVHVVMDKLSEVAPAEAVSLVGDSLDRVISNQSGSIAMIAVGTALALWTATGAATALMRALNRCYDREETRGFVRQRLTALVMVALATIAIGLAVGLLVLGPHLSRWVGQASGLESLTTWLWWTAQWPILVLALLGLAATTLYLGPNVEHPRWQFITPGTLFGVVVWLVASGLFALYLSLFGSYNKTWGSLAAVVILLTWLWLSALVLLLGAEINAEAERSRELRQGRPADVAILAPEKGG